MHYVIALGNPGVRYKNTRHNVGWVAADAIVAEAALASPRSSSRYLGLLTEGEWNGKLVSILYPTTYMNRSGESVMSLVPKDKRPNMIVLHDDIALPLGRVRISSGSSAGGHNGVQSIIDACGMKDFVRVRLGVGAPPPAMTLERFVLEEFLHNEEVVVNEMVGRATLAVKTILREGVQAAMNIFNEEKQRAV